MQIAHRAHAALVELVEELNERSSERGPWALTVQPGCNIATVRKCMMMIKHGPRDREFIDAVVDRGNELVRPIDLARMMRSGEEWASEDHGVIFYRLVRVLNGARAIAPDETEFGRRDDVARDVQEAMTHAAELGFVVLHEGKAYTDHMHEITIPNGTRFGTVSESKKANKPSFGSKGHQRDMVRKIEINEVKNGKETKTEKEKVCCPVFVSGDTRFLVKCIGTMRNTETPVQVEGVHLTERLVCKHVALYHQASWNRHKQESCAGDSKNKNKDDSDERAANELEQQIDTLKQEAAQLETRSKNLENSVKKWEEASEALINKAKKIVDDCNSAMYEIRVYIATSRNNVLQSWPNFTPDEVKGSLDSMVADRNRLQTTINGIILFGRDKLENMKQKAIDEVKTADEESYDYGFPVYEHMGSDYLSALHEIQTAVVSSVKTASDAMETLHNLYEECNKLYESYQKKKGAQADTSGWFSAPRLSRQTVDTEIKNHMLSITEKYKSASLDKELSIQAEIDVYYSSHVKVNTKLVYGISNLSDRAKAAKDEVTKKEREKGQLEEKKAQKQTTEKSEDPSPLDLRAEPDLNITQVPQDADMCVAVQVSGELFRIVHLTRDVDTQREKKAKREEEEEKAKGEEAKKTKKPKKEEKAEKAEEEEIKKYDKAGYAEKMKKDKDGNYKGDKDADVVRLAADYDDYKECVSAARKYLEETCIVNDTPESWSSAAWRLTKECREEASRTSGTGGTSGTTNFGHLEASDRLELVLVPRNLFGHVYGKGPEPTYEGRAEIRKDGIWIYEANGRGKVCPKCAVCDYERGSTKHPAKKNTSGLFVLYNKSDKDRIQGLSSRFCFHRQNKPV